ncbi:MAG: ester cyclase [Actinomycetota bacterium]|jgi:steroid delta-isomerase-like uncharacterized protein
MTLSPEEMRRYNEAFYTAMNDKDLDGVLSMMDDSVVDHQLPPEMPSGKEGAKAFFNMMFGSAPDMRFEILDTVVSGNRIATRSRVTGTQTGEFMQMPATGKPFDVEGIDIVQVNEEGKVTEHWGIFDFMKMMQQVGLAPQP